MKRHWLAATVLFTVLAACNPTEPGAPVLVPGATTPVGPTAAPSPTATATPVPASPSPTPSPKATPVPEPTLPPGPSATLEGYLFYSWRVDIPPPADLTINGFTVIARSKTQDKPYYRELTGINRDYRFSGLPLDAEIEIIATHPNFNRSNHTVLTRTAGDRKYLPIEVFPIYYHAR